MVVSQIITTLLIQIPILMWVPLLEDPIQMTVSMMQDLTIPTPSPPHT